MALNPPLVPGGLPMGIVGERFCVERYGVQLQLDAPGMPRITESGRIFLTTVRICFIPDKGTPGMAAFDIPLQGISEEDFCQPIFGANYLKGAVAPVPGRGLIGPAKFKLSFYKGGAQTFLNFFFKLMEKYREADAAARRAFFESQRAVQNFIQEMQAFVDPSDPSTIFIVQPAGVTPPPAPGPSVPTAPVVGPPVASYGEAPRGAPLGSSPFAYAPVPMASPAYGMSPAVPPAGSIPPGYSPAPMASPAYGMSPAVPPAGSIPPGYAPAPVAPVSPYAPGVAPYFPGPTSTTPAPGAYAMYPPPR